MGRVISLPRDTNESSFLAEVREQWREATRIRHDAEAAGDGWLSELMTGRLEDLRELVARSGQLISLERQPVEA
jgi:hypothetical protein